MVGTFRDETNGFSTPSVMAPKKDLELRYSINARVVSPHALILEGIYPDSRTTRASGISMT